MTKVALPIDAIMADAVAGLRSHGTIVLRAEPGAGKTTRFPLGLLADSDLEGTIVVVQPRRIAARMAAHYVAELLGTKVGDRVGYRVRFDAKAGPATRLLFVTEGMLLRMLGDQRGLDGVGVVIFDEFHERSVALDLGLAILTEKRRHGGPKLVVMSATMELGSVVEYLGGCPCLDVAGRAFPVEVTHLEVPDKRKLHEQVRSALVGLAREGLDGDVLIFLPGAGEIRQCMRACESLADQASVELLALYGSMPLEQQRKAVAPSQKRKFIFATNIAETSLTIDGVTVVVDSGLVREAGFHAKTGVTSLVVRRVSRASATQRMGRAGRTQPGRCLRLYTRQELQRQSAFDTPEILRADLSSSSLLASSLGAALESLALIDSPSEGALARARMLLLQLGAMTDDGVITEIGHQLVKLPVHPRLGRVVLAARERGMGRSGALLAALLSERDIRANRDAVLETGPSDILALKDLFDEAEAASFRAAACSRAGLHRHSVELVRRARDQLAGRTQDRVDDEILLQESLLLGFPDRVASLEEASGGRRGERDVVMCMGGRYQVAASSGVRDAQWVLALELDELGMGGGRKQRARLLSQIEPEWLLEHVPNGLEDRDEFVFNERHERVERVSQILYYNLVLDETRGRAGDSSEVTARLVQEIERVGVEHFIDGEKLDGVLERMALVRRHWPELEAPNWSRSDVGAVLASAARGAVSFRELREPPLLQRLLGSLDWEVRDVLDRFVPERVTLPSGRKLVVHYEPSRPPWVESFLQDFFGMSQGPSICDGRLP